MPTRGSRSPTAPSTTPCAACRSTTSPDRSRCSGTWRASCDRTAGSCARSATACSRPRPSAAGCTRATTTTAASSPSTSASHGCSGRQPSAAGPHPITAATRSSPSGRPASPISSRAVASLRGATPDRRRTMGKLVVTEFVSVDGVFEDPGGSEGYEHGAWTFEYDRGDDGNKFKLDELMEAEVHLLGRVTYEGFAAAWPSREGEFADRLNSDKKVVVSTTVTDPEWQNTTVISD